jgi:endoglucanase
MRKSLKKQLITTVLSMGIVISLLSGCGDQKETKSTTKKADVTQSADQEAKDPVNTGLAAGDTSVLEKKAGKMRDITSQQLIKEMKIGWNLGNSLDVCEADTDGDGKVNQTPKPGKKVDETLWGNVKTTQKLFDSLKKDGINAVRIPVTWRDHIIDKKKNTIDPAWMDRVEEVVRYAYTNGMYVIINLHHDGGGDPDFGAWIRSASEGDKTKTEVFERYKALWTQIASRFQNYSDYLIFESMNEVGFDDMEENKAFALLNEFNQTFVDTVRSSGGNNAKRHLLIAGYWTDIEKTCTGIENGTFKMPKDTIKDREILSVHYYTPWQFCTTNQQNTWGSKEEIKQMHDLIDQLDKTCVKKEIPVIVGEYGFGPNDPASCRYFVENFVKYTYDKGIASFLWDNGEQYDRTKMEWKLNGLIDALKRATSHKSYTINKK